MSETDPGDARLVDCGEERRLDRLGPYLVDRPSPAAWLPMREPEAWARADARFERASRTGGAGWTGSRIPDGRWTVATGGLVLELRLADGGQVGLFLEQLPLWDLVRSHLAATARRRVLNLFAYTGGMTLAAASAGAEVVHVDASRTAVGWARRNAELSDLEDAPVKWIVDDAEAYVRRETRRGRRYDLVILDPPSYGHGGRGSGWRLEERLPGLLAACAAVLADAGTLLLTAHTPGFDADRLTVDLRRALGGESPDEPSVPADAEGGLAARGTVIEGGPLDLHAESGALLPAGAYALATSGGGERRTR